MRERVAVFVDGDYWHARRLRQIGLPAFRASLRRLANRQYWLAKFTGRVKRDELIASQLRREGWYVLRFWESDINKDVAPAVRRIVKVLARRRKNRKER